MNEVVLLIGHGTRDAEGVAELRAFAERFNQTLGEQRPVHLCFLEQAEPLVMEMIERCVAGGAKRIIAIPFLLLAANHVKNDLANLIDLARRQHTQVEIRFGGPIGLQPLLLEILADQLAAVEQVYPSRFTPAETALLLARFGNNDPEANREVYKLARLLWEGRGYGWMEVTFLSNAKPNLPEAIERCRALGARRVVVLPYILFTGLLIKRLHTIIAQLSEQYPNVELVCANYLGQHPRLVELAHFQLAQVT
ncbi:MAG: sirohydrochlorin chelatase [Chloroflexota bacterium]